MDNDSDIDRYVTVAYDRFVSYYDLGNFAPLWVAYATDRASARRAKQNSRTGKTFARPDFFTDGVIADASSRINVQPTEDDDFSDKVPEGLTGADMVSPTISAKDARARPAIIERGHLAPNNAMKNWGSKTKGRNAQFESFSLANVVPQMKRHNAPTWSALEAQCLKWADELRSVCVIVGPVYTNAIQPRHIQERKTGQRVDIPCPDALFCVVIGERENTMSAIGFVMPHITADYSYSDKAVPIDQIEQATGINFMPLLNEPNPLEQTIDGRWLSN